MFDGRWRAGVDRGTKPLGVALHRTGMTANQLTAAGLVLAVGAAVAIAAGHLLIGLLLVLGAALPDLLDGPLAKAAGTTSPRGAFFDSVSDRITDSLLLGGVAWYLGSTRGPHAALLPFAVLGASALVSYERAKAESLGFDAKGGIMERAERIIVLAIGLLVPFLLVGALWFMLAMTMVTAVQRFVKVWRQAGVQKPVPPAAQRWTMAGVEARWKARRDTPDASMDERRERYAQWRERRRAALASRGTNLRTRHRPRSRP
jgi:CDP-diacylglycerol--glycerol-3-phosphate 3-phosphatidyltransferase